jgi:hypothetical protein
MGDLVRKQIYLERRQVQAIQRKAKALKTNESELIRQAIERDVFGSSNLPTRSDPAAWDEIMAFIATRETYPLTGDPYQFNREDLYEDLNERTHGTHSD